MVIIEAMALEKGVIATNFGGPLEIIDHNVDGFLIPAQKPDILADQIIMVINDTGLQIRIGKNAREKVTSKFNVLDYQGAEVRKDGNSATMHHKVFIIDEKIVITGSFNPSKNADTKNDENILVIENTELASKFLEEFDLVWAEAKQS